MKKEIKLENVLFIGVCIIIVYVLTVCAFMNKINGYEEKLEASNKAYDELVTENNDLQDNVYKMYNKQPYQINITHDNENITYKQDKFGLFDSYYSLTSYTLGE